MVDKWFISDTHFFHANFLTFTDNQGELVRGSTFSSVEEMNETMVERWNKVVKPQDKIYHLGDVAVGVPQQSEFTHLLRRLNGHKRLYLGNHDNIQQPAYNLFERIQLWSGGTFKDQNFVCSHIPLPHDQMRDGEYNVHGHIHDSLIDDPRYLNVCVEHTNYAPIHMDELIAIIKDRRL